MAEGTCGTGNWSGPKPGDPDTTNVHLTAATAYGGINVSWTYPNINAHAVAHTKVFRSLTDNFAFATERSIASGNFYFDPITVLESTLYFYWIKMVSINGTVGSLIGPALAVAIPRKQQTLAELTGLIDAGVLAASLKTDIANITQLGIGLRNETLARTQANVALADALKALQNSNGEAATYLLNETKVRKTADSAMVAQMNVIAAGVAGNTAAIISSDIVRATADSAIAGTLTLLTVKVDQSAAAVLTEANTRATADSALAQQINTTQSALYGDLATVETRLQTKINVTDGKVTDIGALYTAKVQVNGLIGGFGIYNNGQIVEAGFDVDRFWIGRTNEAKVKPFVVDNGIVYIDKARIRDADITTLKIAGNAVILPVGDFIVDQSSTRLNVTIVVNGLNVGEEAPLHVHYGVVVGQTTHWNHLFNGVAMGSGDNSIAGTLSYIGTQYYVQNGTYTIGIALSSAPTSWRRLSILAQVVKR